MGKKKEKSIEANEEYALGKVKVVPEKMTVVNALDVILMMAEDSELDDGLWYTVSESLAYLREITGLTDGQLLLLAIMVNEGDAVTWKNMADFLGCSRLKAMTLSDELEGLIEKRWIFETSKRENYAEWQAYKLVYGVVNALRHNKTFIPEPIENLTEQKLIDKACCRVEAIGSGYMSWEQIQREKLWIMQLAKANPQLPLCREICSMGDNIHDQTLLMYFIVNYVKNANTNDEVLTLDDLEDILPDDKLECDGIRYNLLGGKHELFERGWVEFGMEDGLVDNERFQLTRKAKKELLSAYTLKVKKNRNSMVSGLTSYKKIKEKTLFFSEEDAKQLNKLTHMLQREELPKIQERLEQQGLRKGFACLFYGSPGTGKTEMVLQLARQTGRDIMQVDISQIRDKWVGESEKNIKDVFDRYRAACKTSKNIPILFFNEADALFNRRKENAVDSVEKMDNAIQNILLQELEDLEGILIATTNLISNLDSAFERRFLFKVEFHKPTIEARANIWTSMISGLDTKTAWTLAERYEFSGGQIENIARKKAIDYVLEGTEPTLETLDAYCRAEKLNSTQKSARIGFLR